jgi:polysaccharide export outer membrane protein
VKNGDVIYVATASSYELSKFLRIVGLIVNPALSWGNNINKITE